MNSYRDLDVWKLGMDIAERIIHVTRTFPREEMFIMVSQIRRSSSSVPYNIAEGWGRDNRGHYIHMLRIANGSLKELETQILLANRVRYLSDQDSADLLALTDREGRMLRSLIRSLGGQ